VGFIQVWGILGVVLYVIPIFIVLSRRKDQDIPWVQAIAILIFAVIPWMMIWPVMLMSLFFRR
jgi:uncharacterized protein YhhL (DUF1145 family)